MSQAFCWHFLPTNLGRGTVKLSINFYKEDKLNTLPLAGFAAWLCLEAQRVLTYKVGGTGQLVLKRESGKIIVILYVNESQGQMDGKL